MANCPHKLFLVCGVLITSSYIVTTVACHIEHSEQFVCGHGKLEKTPALRFSFSDLPMNETSSATNDGSSGQKRSPGFESIRIHTHYDLSLWKLVTSQLEVIRLVIPTAVSYFQSTLKVRRRTKPINIPRRGLNPPHRVKSISMMSFTPDEMDYLHCHGNDLSRRTWLGLYDSHSHTEPDSKDEMKIKDFMGAKYEKNRWYVAPTEDMFADARKQNTIPEKKPEQARPLRTLGGHIPNLIVQSNQPPRVVAAPPPPIQASSIQQTKDTVQAFPAPQRSATMDLLGDLGGDPFASPAPTAVPVSASVGAGGGGFADFANFDGSVGQPAMTPHSGLAPVASSVMAAPPSDDRFNAFSTSSTTQAAPGAMVAPLGGGDKYAALADLDSVFGATSSGLPVNWDASFGGGGRESWAGGGQAGTSNGVTASTPATVANPFGGSSSAAFSQPSAAHQMAPNPFMAQSVGGAGGYQQAAPQPPAYATPQPPAYGQFAQPYPTGCTTAGYPTAQYAPNNAGQFQNGSMAATPPSTGAWGAFGGGGGYGMMGAVPGQQSGVGAPVPVQQQYGVTPPMSGWGGQPVAGNPFMSAAAGQHAVPPRGSSTNPFL